MYWTERGYPIVSVERFSPKSLYQVLPGFLRRLNRFGPLRCVGSDTESPGVSTGLGVLGSVRRTTNSSRSPRSLRDLRNRISLGVLFFLFYIDIRQRPAKG